MITISRDASVQMQKETLLHEILHAIEHQSGLDIPEAVISALSVGIFGVMRDNPRLAKALFIE